MVVVAEALEHPHGCLDALHLLVFVLGCAEIVGGAKFAAHLDQEVLEMTFDHLQLGGGEFLEMMRRKKDQSIRDLAGYLLGILS